MKQNAPLAITISRQLGSGGAYVGQQLAKRLNIHYADREIISQAAKQLSVLEEDLESRDEKTVSFWQSFLELWTLCNPDSYVPPQGLIPKDQTLFETEARVIERIANERSVVIIGRCGSYVLRKHPNHIGIFLHADIDWRKERVKEVYKVSEETAKGMIAKSDAQRAQYHHTFTGKAWTDSNQYDISIDTGRIGVDKSVELILKYLDLRGKKI